MALVGQIAGKPRQEKHQRGVAGKLTQAGAEDLATAQQTFGVTPVKWNVLDFIVRIFAPIYSSSALFAVRDSCGS
jgi:hypothetical protein